MSLPEAITRKEMYYAYLTGTGTNYPEPITREEQYLYYLCENGGIGGGSGTVTPEEIEAAVTKYLDENPVQAGATAEEAAQIQKNADDIALLQESAIEIDNTLLKEGYAADAKEAGRRIDSLAIKRTASGKTILLTDASQMPFGLVEYGWTAQETTTGAQLLDFSGAADSTNATSGMAATVNGDGSYTIAGTALDSAGNLWLMGGYYKEENNPAILFTLPAGTYTVSGVTLYRYQTAVDGTLKLGANITFTLSEDTIITGVRNPVLTIGETYNETIYPMLNAGSTALPWEPYTGGIPSPNPDYPQELVSAGDKGCVETNIFSGNLLDISSLSIQTIEGVTFTPQLDGGVKVSGTATAQADYYIIGSLSKNESIAGAEKGESFITCSGLDDNCYIRYIGTPGNADIRSYPYAIMYENDCKIIIRVNSGTKVDKTLYPMFSNKNIPYEPYKQRQILHHTTPNGLPGIPVSSGGNYTDETGQQWIADYRDWERGVDVQCVKKIIVDTVDQYDTGENFGYIVLNDVRKTGKRVPILSNCFVYEESIKIDGVAFAYETVLRLYHNLGSVSAFNDWLAQNEVYVIYPLATPIETPIPAAELAAYHATRTNNPNTTVTNDEGCWMEMEYTVDTETYINNNYVPKSTYETLEERVAALETQALSNI